MSNESLRERILQLASASDRQALAQMRAVFPEIEMALKAGVRRAQLVEALQAEGVEISPEVFTNYVIKLRRERAMENDRRKARGLGPLPDTSPAGDTDAEQGVVFDEGEAPTFEQTPSEATPTTSRKRNAR